MPTILQQAIKAHQAGKLSEAENLYRQAISSNEHKAAAFQNLGALLRKKGKDDDALSIYNEGLKYHPDNAGILANRANTLRAEKPASALYDTLKAIELAPGLSNAWQNAISILSELDCHSFALYVARKALQAGCCDAKVLVQIFSLLNGVDDDEGLIEESFLEEFSRVVKLSAANLSILEKSEVHFVLGFSYAKHGYTAKALEIYRKTLKELTDDYSIKGDDLISKRDELITSHSWNLACLLLKAQDFSEGWKLYDYGLRVPTKSAQQWQRALRKHFSAEEVALWRGENLTGSRLLLLEEQGIGDTMMFLSLVPGLVDEAKRIDIVLSERLAPIYARSLQGVCKVWTHDEVAKKAVSADAFDYQTALGSICQYRFTTIEAYAPKTPILCVDIERSQRLRRSYLERLNCNEGTKLIGVSWSGGGSKSRVQAKSMPLAKFEEILQPVNAVRFISLQYGDVKSRVTTWSNHGIQIIHDDNIDPLIDMDTWLHQVAACDAVLSVANTTIHGAGGLDVSTLCLLSKESDWRWLSDNNATRSYWYNSVGIAHEDPTMGWDPAIQQARSWLEEGCPMPSSHSQPASPESAK